MYRDVLIQMTVKDWELVKFAYFLLKYALGFPLQWFDVLMMFSQLTIKDVMLDTRATEDITHPTVVTPSAARRQGRRGSVIGPTANPLEAR